MKVWVTRARPGAERTAARLAALGHEPLVAPLLAVRPIPGGDLSLHGVAALAFTSANGVAAFAAAQGAGRDLPVFAVGGATAHAARAAGFRFVRSADGDVEALAELVIAGPPQGIVLPPAAREPGGDLGGALAAAGVSLQTVPVYETLALPLPSEAADAWRTLDAVLLHSPRASRALVAALGARPTDRLLAACISEAAAAPLRGRLADVRSAAAPDEDALLALLGKPAAPG